MKQFKYLLLGFYILILPVSSNECPSFQNATEDVQQEVLFSFHYPQLGNHLINTIYSENKLYLPLMELFDLFYIHYEFDTIGYILKGGFPEPNNKWVINLTKTQVIIGKQTFDLSSSDFRIGSTDIYLSPELFERLFGLHFNLNLSALQISLETDQQLPVIEKLKREKLHSNITNKTKTGDFPLRFQQKKQIAGLGFVDYNIGIFGHKASSLSGYFILSGSMALLGGDLHGSVYGSSNSNQPLVPYNFYWHYALRTNPLITSIKVGRINTTGTFSQQIQGVSISNEPVMPRRLYSQYMYTGNIAPEAEVELYLNGQLSGFTKADGLGNYRVALPLYYGTNTISVKTYSPTGEIDAVNRQVQIPYAFLPKGTFSYNIQVGNPFNQFSDSSSETFLIHSDVAFGINHLLTAKAGIDYYNKLRQAYLFGVFSARLFEQYLFSIEVAPGSFYRFSSDVVYAWGGSVNLSATVLDNENTIPQSTTQQEFRGSIYLPFRMYNKQSGFLLGMEHFNYGYSCSSYLHLNFNTKVRRLDLRLTYRYSLYRMITTEHMQDGLLSSSLAYSAPYSKSTPALLKGAFIRGQIRYNVYRHSWHSLGVQINKIIHRRTQVSLNLESNLLTHRLNLLVGVVFDLKHIRTTTRLEGTPTDAMFQQNFVGSVGFDLPNRSLFFSNHELSDKAAVSVIFFIDNNNNRIFDPKEKVIPARSIRLNQAAAMEMGRDSILRISQLQNYWKYSAEIILPSSSDPTLAPLYYQFSFIADPGRFKQIEIPFYRTGILEGTVYLKSDSSKIEMAGVRLLLINLDTKDTAIIRTFNDGSYYKMSLLPGHYSLEVDTVQLHYLGVSSIPSQRSIEVKQIVGGDDIKKLDFILRKNTTG